MLRAHLCLIAAALLVAPSLGAQQQPASGPKQATAVRVPDGAIELDGALNEPAWGAATPIVDFVQKEPVEGAVPSRLTEVRIAYDANALYVGARMYSPNGADIQAPLGGRDQSADVAEHILVSLDTFLDHRTAYTFGVTASGARLDRFHATDQEDDADDRFDPVWQARTRVDAQGWTAELWIPFTQLRFNDQSVQVWGLELKRFIPTLQEEDYWVEIPRTVQAWSSRFGELRGIEGIRSGRRLEALPFVVGSSTMNGGRDLRNPFDDGRNLDGRAGLDMKAGVGPNLTLDATVNPDFGQVEADPAEVNLSAFATRFPEKRPFFSQGANLFTLRQYNAFYSRRIGAPPAGTAQGDFVDRPATSRIISAAKLTGRLPSGTSIGVLGAVTDQEYARVFDLGAPGITKVRVAPHAEYGVAKVQQEFGRSGSSFGVLVGGLHRQMDASDPLASLIARSEVVVGSDGLVRSKSGEYQLTWTGVGTYVAGEPPALERIQRSSELYMQRPDRDYWRMDPARRTLPGWGFSTSIDKIGGRHWLFDLQLKFDGPTLDLNELGQLNSADGFEPRPSLTYRETRPGKLFRNYSLNLRSMDEWTFGWDRQRADVTGEVDVTWLSFWTSSVEYTRMPRTNSVSLTRGGPLMGGPSGWRTEARFGSPNASQTRVSGSFSASANELGGSSTQVEMTLSARPSPRWQLSVSPTYERSTDPQQYVTTLAGGRAETFGSRYVFAFIDRSTISSQLRLSYVVTPDLTLDAYAEPFAASGRYYGHGELLAPGSMRRIVYGTDGGQLDVKADGSRTVTIDGSTFTLANTDFNVRTFNSNLVLKWEWRPGSTVYLVWQQSRNARDPIGTRVGAGDMFSSLTAPGSNILLFKTSFWLPL